jgi:CrcB protein
MTPLLVLAVLGAGALGALARYAAGLAAARTRSRLPWAVLVVNVVGSLLAGLAVGLTGAGALPADLELVIASGFAGGLTTFSTLSVETVQLAIEGRWRSAAASVGANLALGIAAAALGFLVASLLG